MLAAGGLFTLIAFFSRWNLSDHATPIFNRLADIPLLVFHNVDLYISHFIWPVDLAPFYPFPETPQRYNPVAYVLIAANIGFILWLIRRWRAGQKWPIGWLIYFLIILPTTPITFYSTTIAADKHAYLACIGLLLMLAAFMARWFQNGGNFPWRLIGATTICMAGIAIGQASLTRGYLSQWRDAQYLAEYVLRRTPNALHMHIVLGVEKEKIKFFKEAIRHFQAYLRVYPESPDIHKKIGRIYYILGKPSESIMHYRRALRIRPNDAGLHVDIGFILALGGNRDQAVVHYRKALLIDPDYMDAHYHLGNELLETGLLVVAVRHFEKALLIDPDFADAHNSLGFAMAMTGNFEQALRHYQRAIAINPHLVQAFYNMGEALKSQGRMDEAVRYFRRAIQIDPNFTEAYLSLGICLGMMGRPEEAMEPFLELIARKPDAPAFFNAGIANLQLNRIEQAILCFERALELDPGFQPARDALARLAPIPTLR